MNEDSFTALALRYPDWADAPYISAKGKGHLAHKIVDIALDCNIPVVENGEMANILSLQEIGSFIPEETYSAIATIFAFVVDLEKRK